VVKLSLWVVSFIVLARLSSSCSSHTKFAFKFDLHPSQNGEAIGDYVRPASGEVAASSPEPIPIENPGARFSSRSDGGR
jgi:hypothetical protein